jgi:hypothetical protein
MAPKAKAQMYLLVPSTTNAAEPLTRIRMRALGYVSRRYATRHTITDLASPDLVSTVCFCIFMGCMHVHARCSLHACYSFTRPPALERSTVRVEEVLRLPPLTLFALEDNQSSASARTHRPAARPAGPGSRAAPREGQHNT